MLRIFAILVLIFSFNASLFVFAAGFPSRPGNVASRFESLTFGPVIVDEAETPVPFDTLTVPPDVVAVTLTVNGTCEHATQGFPHDRYALAGLQWRADAVSQDWYACTYDYADRSLFPNPPPIGSTNAVREPVCAPFVRAWVLVIGCDRALLTVTLTWARL